MLITSGLVLIIANLVDLSAIASVGSAVSLMVFLFVGIAGWRRRADTRSSPVIVALAIAVIAIVLGFFAACTRRGQSSADRGRAFRRPRGGHPAHLAVHLHRLAFAAGADQEYVAAQVGHEDVTTTNRIYRYVLQRRQRGEIGRRRQPAMHESAAEVGASEGVPTRARAR